MNHHDGREVTIRIPASLDERIAKAREQIDARTGAAPCEHDLIGLILERGLDSVLIEREKDSRLVGDLTVREIGEFFGITDIEAARRSASEARATQTKLLEMTHKHFASVKAASEFRLEHIGSEAALAKWNETIAHVIKTHAMHVVALFVAVRPGAEGETHQPLTPVGLTH